MELVGILVTQLIYRLMMIDVHAVSNDNLMPLNYVVKGIAAATTAAQIASYGDIQKYLRRLNASDTIKWVSTRG